MRLSLCAVLVVGSTLPAALSGQTPVIDHHQVADEYNRVRAENDWASQQVALYPDRAGFEGRFAYEAEGSDNIRAAIDRAVAPMNFFIRPIARARLRNANPLARTIVIERRDGDVLVSFDDDPPVRAPENGDVVPWARADGERMRIRMAWNDGELHQSFFAKDGRRDNVFALQPDGIMLLTVTITSDRLPRPLVYRLRYRRE